MSKKNLDPKKYEEDWNLPAKMHWIPPHLIKRREHIKQLATLADQPDWWEGQLEKIRCGDTLDVLAVEMSIPFTTYRNWIIGDTKREKDYIAAFKERKARLMQKVEEKLMEIALNPTGHPKHADSLRAAEILRSTPSSGELAPQAPVNLNIMFVEAKDGKPAHPRIIEEVATAYEPNELPPP